MYKGIDFVKLPAHIWAIISAVCMLITNIIGIGTPEVTPGLELVSTDKVILEDAMFTGQGITTDGEYYYTSGAMTGVKMNGLSKRNVSDFSIVKTKLGAIPEKYVEEHGSNHIGGISYYNGYIYASLEDSKQWQHPVIALYDAETLEYTGICHEVSSEILTRGIPWVAVDAENGFIYASHSKTVEEIHCFDLDTFEYVKSFAVSDPMDAIQGGEVYKGKLYVGTNDSTRAVYTIDVKNGKVEKLFDRIMYQPKLIDNFGGEGEDLTVYPMEDGTLIHALDIGALFIDSNLRHYKWDA